MIELTGIDGSRREFRESMITELKSVPETVLVLRNNDKFIVRESIEEIIAGLIKNARFLDFRASGRCFDKGN